MRLFTFSFKERILLLVVFIFLFSSILHIIRPVNDDQRVLKNYSFWAKKTFNSQKYDVVVFGDSRIYRGFSANHFSRSANDLSAINIGYASAGYSEPIFRLIDKRIKKNSKHRVIILGITPLSLTPEGARNSHYFECINIKREERIELQYFYSTLNFFLPYTLKSLFESFKGTSFEQSYLQEYFDDGWVASDTRVRNPESSLDFYKTRFVKNQVSNEVFNNLIIEIDEWINQGISVYAFRPPTTSKMVAVEDSLSGYNAAYIIDNLKKHRVHWIELAHEDYISYDGSHIEKQSAIKLSKYIGEIVKEDLFPHNPN